MEIPTKAATDKPLDPRVVGSWQILSFCSTSVELMEKLSNLYYKLV